MQEKECKELAKEIRIFIQTTSADGDPSKNSEYQENRIVEMIKEKFPSIEWNKSAIDINLPERSKTFKYETWVDEENGCYIETISYNEELYKRQTTYHNVKKPYMTVEIFKCTNCDHQYDSLNKEDLVKYELPYTVSQNCFHCNKPI